MGNPVKQHLIDPEICIRCYSCEAACPIEAITHNDDNVVVDGAICAFCMACVAVCPTGSIDEWRIVETHYSVDEQFSWEELPEQAELSVSQDDPSASLEALDSSIAALLEEAHKGAGGKARAPQSASRPSVNLFNLNHCAQAVVQGNYRLTAQDSDTDVRHIILDLGAQNFPVLEGQSVGIIAPGKDTQGKAHLPRLYSISSPRNGERPNFNNLSLTVKRETKGICSNYVCDLEKGDVVNLTGPFGSTFLLPGDPQAHVLMICTGTGSAPFRGFTMRRQREIPEAENSLSLYFGARRENDLPYFGPLAKIPDKFMHKSFAFSRVNGQPKHYVQDRLRHDSDRISMLLQSAKIHIYICGLKAMESGVEEAFHDIAREAGLDWSQLRTAMREEGRYHVETY